MHLPALGWGFWWLNVFACVYSIGYWARRRFPDGTHALIMPSGQFWVWQLAAAIVVLIIGASPWNLIWLAVVSVVMSVAIGKLMYGISVRADYASTGGVTATSPQLQEPCSPEIASLASFMPDGEQREALQNFLSLNPELAEKISGFQHLLHLNESSAVKLELSLSLVDCGRRIAAFDDLFTASSILAYSLTIFPKNPIAWAEMAVVYCAWEDQIAAKWATRVLNFRVLKTSPEVHQLWSREEYSSMLKDARKQMREILAACSEHPEWRDSYPLKKAAGIVDF